MSESVITSMTLAADKVTSVDLFDNRAGRGGDNVICYVRAAEYDSSFHIFGTPQEIARLAVALLDAVRPAMRSESDGLPRCDGGDLPAADTALPSYEPTFPVVDGVEQHSGRLACCGAGTDQRDPRTTERLHLPGCSFVADMGIRAGRDALHGVTAEGLRDLARMVDEQAGPS